MRGNRLHYFARVVGLLIGVASFVFLVAEGVPGQEGPLRGKQITLSHTRRSGCPTRCSEPEHTKTKVSVSNSPASPAEDPSLIEKALDNDAGVLVIRFLLALVTALTTATALERLLRAPDEAAPVENRRDNPPDKRGPPVGPAPQGDLDSGPEKADAKEAELKSKAEEDAREAEEERAAEGAREAEEERAQREEEERAKEAVEAKAVAQKERSEARRRRLLTRIRDLARKKSKITIT